MADRDRAPAAAAAAGAAAELPRPSAPAAAAALLADVRRTPRFAWSSAFEETFFRSLCESVTLGLREHNTFKPDAWDRAIAALRDSHGALVSKSHLVNKSDNARKRFRLWRSLREDSRFLYNPITRCVTGSDEAWNAHIESEPLSKVLRGRPFEFEEYMEILYPDVIGSAGMAKRAMRPPRRRGTGDAAMSVVSVSLSMSSAEEGGGGGGGLAAVPGASLMAALESEMAVAFPAMLPGDEPGPPPPESQQQLQEPSPPMPPPPTVMPDSGIMIPPPPPPLSEAAMPPLELPPLHQHMSSVSVLTPPEETTMQMLQQASTRSPIEPDRGLETQPHLQIQISPQFRKRQQRQPQPEPQPQPQQQHSSPPRGRKRRLSVLASNSVLVAAVEEERAPASLEIATLPPPPFPHKRRRGAARPDPGNEPDPVVSGGGDPGSVVAAMQQILREHRALLERVLSAVQAQTPARSPPRWSEQAMDIFMRDFADEDLDLQIKIAEKVLADENKAMVFCKFPAPMREHWVKRLREIVNGRPAQ